jgi:hypothetical protein
MFLWIIIGIGVIIIIGIWMAFRNVAPIQHFNHEAIHAIVIMHGFHSTPGESRWLVPQILSKFGKNVSILRTSIVPSGRKLWWWQNIQATHDGIQVLASRCVEQIIEFLKQHEKLEKISFVGQSLGGLYGREVVSQLGNHHQLKPGAFITLASPNLGCRDLIERWYGWILTFLALYCWGKTGLELMGFDTNIFISKNLEKHQKDLSGFKKVSIASKDGDLHVPTSSSVITRLTHETQNPSHFWLGYFVYDGMFFFAHAAVAACLPFFAVGRATADIVLRELA